MITLIKNMELIKVAQKSKGALEETHCRFWNGWVAASNSIISCAHPVPVDLMTCPETYLFIKAIKEGKKEVLTFTIDNGHLSVNSEKYQVNIPCVKHEELPPIFPDTQKYLLGNELLEAIVDAGKICRKTKSPITEVILIEDGCCYATNGEDATQAYHGYNFGCRWFVPVEFATALEKWQNKKLISLGYSANSLTLIFDDAAWIKSQLFPATLPYPDYKSTLCTPFTGSEYCPTDAFFDALRHFKRCGASAVWFEGQSVRSAAIKTIIPIPNLTDCKTMKIESLLAVEELADKLSFDSDQKLTLWVGKTSRGVIAKNV